MKKIYPVLLVALLATAAPAFAQMPPNSAPTNSLPGQAVLPTAAMQQQQFQQMQQRQAQELQAAAEAAAAHPTAVQASPGYGGTADQILSAPATPTAPTAPTAPATPAVAGAGTAAPAAPAAASQPVVDPCAAFMASADLYATCQDRNMKIQRMKDAQKARNTAPAPAAPAAPVTTGAQNGVPQTTTGAAPGTNQSGVIEQQPAGSAQKSDGPYIQRNPNGFVIKPIKKQVQ